jgi:hypothetical protein
LLAPLEVGLQIDLAAKAHRFANRSANEYKIKIEGLVRDPHWGLIDFKNVWTNVL